MKRNQPSRSKRRPSRQEKFAARPAGEGLDSAAEGSMVEDVARTSPTGDDVATTKAIHGGGRGMALLTSRLLLIAALIVLVGLVMLYVAGRREALYWPSANDIGLLTTGSAVATLLLVAAGALAWGAWRAARSARQGVARGCLVLTLVLAAAAVALGYFELRQLYHQGLWRRSTVGPVSETADLYYLQAVRRRLDDLFQVLERRRLEQPDTFSDEAEQQLAVVTYLQKNMVTWTENQIGHWLDDDQQRHELVQLLAYQVFPLGFQYEAAEQVIQDERRELARQRSWFQALNDYCLQKTRAIGQSNSTAPAADSAAKAKDEQAGDAVSASQTADQLDQEMLQKLDKLGLADWRYAQWVIADSSDLAMAGERLNQTAARVAAIAGRLAYLDDDTVWPTVDGNGLNGRYPWLRLPVCLPSGNSWLGSFFAMQGLMLVCMASGGVISLVLVLTRFQRQRLAFWKHAAWWWLAISGMAVVMFLLFYVI